jgi:hypothetical protein
MTKPRPHSVVSWHLRMPEDLAREVDRMLLDPWTGRVGFGRRAELVVALLGDWLSKNRQLPAPEPEEFLSDHPKEVSNNA